MTTSQEIWDIIKRFMRRGDWYHLDTIYQLVESHTRLDAEDFEPQSPGSDVPKWKRNVRNVLQYRKGIGQIKWDQGANYMLP